MSSSGSTTDKPILKAGSAYHKYMAKRKLWPLVRDVAMNPVAQPSEVGTASTLANPSLSKEIPLLGAKRVLLLLAGLDDDSKPKLYRRRTRAQERMKCVLWLIKKKNLP